MVPELISRMDRWLATNRPDYYSQLQPGVTTEQLNAFEDRFSVQLPIAFRLLYKWRNGQRPDCSMAFQFNWMFSSLEAVASQKETLDAMIGKDLPSAGWWHKEWVPFLQNGGGDCTVVDLLGIESGQKRQLVIFWHDDADRPISHANLEMWMEEMVESMESGELELA